MHTTHTYGRYRLLFAEPSISHRVEKTRDSNIQMKRICFLLLHFPEDSLHPNRLFLYMYSPQEMSKLTFLIIQLKNENAFG